MNEKNASTEKLWGGRFTENISSTLKKLNSSIEIDKRMYFEDIKGSIAYSESLYDAKILTLEEYKSITEGLKKVQFEWDNNEFEIKVDDEDIHTANERRLTELIGSTARKLHVGRSRNDQTTTDTKMWLRKSIDSISTIMIDMIQMLAMRSEKEIEILMPGYTHLQRAQPVRWSHWLLSHTWSLKNDVDKLHQLRQNLNISPLGSGALAGNPLGIDRTKLALKLEFDSATSNSMHAVGDRDYVAEFLFWASLTSIHLSKIAEDVIIYSSEEFKFIKLSDSFSTGSSLMPQKRNPDSMELIRGKTGTILGKCFGFMATLKGTPSTYNKDLQEDKEALFSTFDILMEMLKVANEALKTLKVNANKCRDSLNYNMLATDIAYYLVRKGIPFRDAHHIVGRIVSTAENKGIAIQNLTLQQLQLFSSAFDTDVNNIWNFENSVEQYKTEGSTCLSAVREQIKTLRNWLKKKNELK
ncbi:argininosuccinate lyase isoform X2 [Leptopilina boulardi]|uniref:argininosuccinate lyase isoform X2 n=1 Tax=Leptopilina boulardi TaxID=63433 RepID=UPI0021F56620|nr:argininosuccinate lyase isoform X2 [Leptopilina boulardi]